MGNSLVVYFICFSGKTYQGQRQPNVVQNVHKPGLKTVMPFSILALFTALYCGHKAVLHCVLYCPLFFTVLCLGNNLVFIISSFILDFFFYNSGFFLNPRILPSQAPTNNSTMLLDILGLANLN